MKILIDINHPAHVHLFRNVARIMSDKNHIVLFTTRKKEVTIELLESYDFEYVNFGKNYEKIWNKVWGILKYDAKMFTTVISFNPDILISMGSIYAAPVAWLVGKPHIAYDDTENMPEKHVLYKPFTSVFLNPCCFNKDFGVRQIKYKGYHELAYLHPNYYKPDDNIYQYLGLKKSDKFTLIRFVGWTASHDIGMRGLDEKNKYKAVEEFSKYSRVFISSEEKLPDNLTKYQIKIPPDKMHDVLHFASLFFGESATMASECAMLGTPAIYVNDSHCGTTIEQEEKYGLLFNYKSTISDQISSINKGIELLQDNSIPEQWQFKRERLLNSNIDVTAFSVWFIENYPESFNIMKNNPDYQYRFLTKISHES